MGKTCYICKKAGLVKLPKAHEKRLLKELGFSESNLPPKSAFFCREHFTEDSFKFVDYRTVWNYNPRVKVLSNDSGTPGNTLGEAGAYEVEILEEYDDESFAGSSVPPSLANDLNQALGATSEEAGYTGFEILNECDDESFAGVSTSSVNESQQNIKWSRGSSWECIVGNSKSLANDVSQALGNASEEAGYTGSLEHQLIPLPTTAEATHKRSCLNTIFARRSLSLARKTF